MDEQLRAMLYENRMAEQAERIASLERTVGEQADQIGGLTSELEQLREDYGRDASDHEVELGEAREVAELAADANSRLRQQLAASQAETATLRDVFKQMPTWMLEGNFIAVPRDRWNRWLTDVGNALATPSAAAEGDGSIFDLPKPGRRSHGKVVSVTDRPPLVIEGEPSAAAERVQAVMAAAEIFATWSEDVWHEPWPQEIIDFRAALDAATAKETLTVEKVKGDG